MKEQIKHILEDWIEPRFEDDGDGGELVLHGVEDAVNFLDQLFAEKEAENARLRAALREYADVSRWQIVRGDGWETICPVRFLTDGNGYDLAHDALEKKQ